MKKRKLNIALAIALSGMALSANAATLTNTGSFGTISNPTGGTGSVNLGWNGDTSNTGTAMGGSGFYDWIGDGGNGGNAVAEVVTSVITSANTFATATATGGYGGSALGVGRVAGNGGSATVWGPVAISGSGNVTATARQIGGDGGNGLSGARAGNGATSSIVNHVSGSTTGTINLRQDAIGGRGGRGDYAGNAGNAESRLTFQDGSAKSIVALIAATGGVGGDAEFGNAAAGGTATAYSNIKTTRAGSYAGSDVYAIGGAGGNSYAGSFGHPTGWMAGNGGIATVLGSFASAVDGDARASATQYGGSGGDSFGSGDAGRGADSTVINKVSGSTTGILTLAQAAFGGDGGSNLYGFGGSGGKALSGLTYSDNNSKSLDTRSEAYGGANGRSIFGSKAGNAEANSLITSTKIGASLSVFSSAVGGNGAYKGGSYAYIGEGGDAKSSATGTGTTNVSVGSNSHAGDGSVKGNALSSATAISSGSTNSVNASAYSSGHQVSAQANSISLAQGSSSAVAQGNGNNGTVSAKSVTTGVVSGASADVSGNVYARSNASVSTALPTPPNSNNPLASSSFSYAILSPNQSEVTAVLANNPNVASAILANSVIAAGAMGATYGTSSVSGTPLNFNGYADFSLANLTGNNPLKLGLTGFNYFSGGFSTLSFTVDKDFGTNSVQTLLSQSFASVNDASAFFNNSVVTLGNYTGGLNLHLAFNLTATTPQGSDFSYFIAESGPGMIIPTNPISGPTLPVPELETYAMMLAGFGLMGFMARRRRNEEA